MTPCPWADCEEEARFTVVRVDPDLGDLAEFICAFHAAYTVEVEGHGWDTDITITISPRADAP
jgi:hypothetical protein